MRKQFNKRRANQLKLQNTGSLNSIKGILQKNAAMERLMESNAAIEKMMNFIDRTTKIKTKNDFYNSLFRFKKFEDIIQKTNKSFGSIYKQFEFRNKLNQTYSNLFSPLENHFKFFYQLEEINNLVQKSPIANFAFSLELKPEETEIIDSIDSNLEKYLPKLLAKHDLYSLWTGANFALSTPFYNNPDKARHMMISLRSLIEYILKDLLPACEEIKCWDKFGGLITKYNGDLPKNVIPRKIQIRYYCEKVDFEFINDFTINEINHINEVYNKLSSVHNAKLNQNDGKLKFLKVRAGTIIWLLLMIYEMLYENELDNP